MKMCASDTQIAAVLRQLNVGLLPLEDEAAIALAPHSRDRALAKPAVAASRLAAYLR